MKKLILLSYLAILVHPGFSQSPSPYAGIFTGVSVPVGKFSAKTLDGGSFALVGIKSGGEGAWFSRIGLGAGLQAGYSVYPVDVTALAYEKMKDNPFIDSMSVRSDPVRVITLAALAEYSFKLNPRLSIVAKAGGGFIYGWSPYQLYKPNYYMLGPEWYEITSDYDLGPYVTVGGTLRYSICECLDLQAHINYDYGFLNYKFMTGTGDIREEDHQVMSVNALVGVAFNF
jgi:hypothetical protein